MFKRGEARQGEEKQVVAQLNPVSPKQIVI